MVIVASTLGAAVLVTLAHMAYSSIKSFQADFLV